MASTSEEDGSGSRSNSAMGTLSPTGSMRSPTGSMRSLRSSGSASVLRPLPPVVDGSKLIPSRKRSAKPAKVKRQLREALLVERGLSYHAGVEVSESLLPRSQSGEEERRPWNSLLPRSRSEEEERRPWNSLLPRSQSGEEEKRPRAWEQVLVAADVVEARMLSDSPMIAEGVSALCVQAQRVSRACRMPRLHGDGVCVSSATEQGA